MHRSGWGNLVNAETCRGVWRRVFLPGFSPEQTSKGSMARLMLLLAFLFLRSDAAPKDLTDMTMILPKDSISNYAKLLPKKEGPLSALSVCLKYDTDIPEEFSLFSMATPKTAKAFVIVKKGKSGPFEVTVNDKEEKFHKVPEKPLSWTHLCVTWDSSTGLVQLWVDGHPSVKKMTSKNTPIQGKPVVILGQTQNSYGGRFDKSQSFVGHITDLHVWDHVLQPCEVEQVKEGRMKQPGDVLDWGSLELEIAGEVILEKSQGTNRSAETGPCVPVGK